MSVLNLSSCSVSRSTEYNQFADLGDEEKGQYIARIYIYICIYKKV